MAITPGDGRPLDAWVRALAGWPGVLIREPSLGRAELVRVVELAVDVVPFVAVHARNPYGREIAAAVGVAVHVAAGAPAPDQAFGASTHSEEEVERALAAGAAYCLLSPVWSPSSKPTDDRPTLGFERFLAIARDRPVLALGGVTPERWWRLREAGAGAAVLGALTTADFSRSMRRYLP